MTDVVQRFINYTKFNTTSDEESNSVPSSPGQSIFAAELGKELQALGLKDVSVDENSYVMATLPANITERTPVVGFIAHMDTSPDMAGDNVQAEIIDNYPGGDIILNSSLNIVMSPADFPELNDYIGQPLITTDGTTLLGADNKAGIAEIITAVEYLINHPEIPHGEIKIAFTPDEEIGRGADHFNLNRFKADLAYTVDGGPLGEIEYENFNAAEAKITIHGTSVHPGTAKDKMVNSMLIAGELINMFPQFETPAHTEGYAGFYHLVGIKGNVEKTTLKYIIRDFDRASFKKKKDYIEKLVSDLNNKYSPGTIELELTDQYYNMKEKIEPVKHIITTAVRAMEMAGIEANISPIRGGTDGARLSYMGLPTPNIFTGGHNFHGKYEFIPIPAMHKAVEVIINIIRLYSEITE